MVLQRLAPIVRGWATYYRTVVSSKAFAKLDSYLWQLTYKWAKHTHPKKSKHWISNRYFGSYNKSRQDRWVFGDRHSGAYLVKHAWTLIVRHQMVKGASSPDDPALAEYWADRRRRAAPRPWTISACDCSKSSRGCARPAGSFSSTPTIHRKTHKSGSNGSAPPARPSPNDRSTRSGAARAITAHFVSYTPDVADASSRRDGRLTAMSTSLWACLSRIRGNVYVRF